MRLLIESWAANFIIWDCSFIAKWGTISGRPFDIPVRGDIPEKSGGVANFLGRLDIGDDKIHHPSLPSSVAEVASYQVLREFLNQRRQ